jgi:hypothetical protein
VGGSAGRGVVPALACYALGAGKRSVGQALEFPQDHVHTEQSIVLVLMLAS